MVSTEYFFLCQYALLTYGNMPVQPRFRVKFLLKFKYENVIRLAFQKKFYSKTRMDGHITIREKSVLLQLSFIQECFLPVKNYDKQDVTQKQLCSVLMPAGSSDE